MNTALLNRPQSNEFGVRASHFAVVSASLVSLALSSAVLGHTDATVSVEELTAKIEFSSWDDLQFVERAAAYQRLGKYEEALGDLKQAASLNPTRVDLSLRRASILLEKGDGERALRDADLYLRVIPNWPEALRIRARALHLCGQHQECFTEWKNLVSQGPEVPVSPSDALETAMASLQCGLPSMKQALFIVETALVHSPADAALRECAIALNAKTGSIDEALRLTDMYMKQLPRKEWWHAKRAAILLRAGRMREAMEACNLAQEAIGMLSVNLRQTRAVAQLTGEMAALKSAASAERAK